MYSSVPTKDVVSIWSCPTPWRVEEEERNCTEKR
jgi:hypothetical protein